jgi:uncharacterized membrane protein
LQPDPATGIGDVLHYLLKESNHPPLYFVLTHLWLSLFPSEGGLVSLWAARSLPALFGVASIPATFGLGYLAFRSRLVGQIAAAMMAVSPYGVFLAREARHYSLAVLFVIASVCCLIIAIKAIHHRTSLALWLGLVWVGINTLGIATHYFFSLTLCAEALVLLALAWHQMKRGRITKDKSGELKPISEGVHSISVNSLSSQPWRQIYSVAAGTLIGGLVWLPVLHSNYRSELTHWIYDRHAYSTWLEPIGRVLAWLTTILVSLPMEITTLPFAIVITSGLGTLIFLVWALPIFYRGFKLLSSKLSNRLGVQVLVSFIVSALVLFFGLTYAFGADLTLAPRYQFVYFPVVITLLGAILAMHWETPILIVPIESTSIKSQPFVVRLFRSDGKKAVILIWFVGLVGGLTIVWNLGYLQNLRSDLFVNVIQNVSNSPILIATTHQHHGHTGRMMGLAWEFKRLDHSNSLEQPETVSPQFLLAHAIKTPTYQDPAITLQKAVAGLPRPLDVWLVNFHAGVDLEQQNCFAVSQSLPKLDSYWYRLYRCPALK